MATIGSFKKIGNGYTGDITTLSVQARNVKIMHEDARVSEAAPHYRVFAGRAEIGAAWCKRSAEGRGYLSLKLDDPSFSGPIFANLFEDDDAETHSLIWSRPNKPSRD